jgi:hypothetical protein
MKIQIIVFVPILFFQPILFLLNIQDHIFEASNLVMFHLFLLLYVKHWPANYDNISWHVNWLLFRIGPLFNFDVLVLFICFYSLRTLIVDVWRTKRREYLSITGGKSMLTVTLDVFVLRIRVFIQALWGNYRGRRLRETNSPSPRLSKFFSAISWRIPPSFICARGLNLSKTL